MASKIAKVNYGSVDQLSSGGGGGDFYKFEGYNNDGVHEVRICPPVEGMTNEKGEVVFWRELWQHWDSFTSKKDRKPFLVGHNDEGEDVTRPVYCAEKHGGKEGDCPFCTLVRWGREDEGDGDVAGGIAAQKTCMVNMIDREDGNKLKLWRAPVSVINGVLALGKIKQQRGSDILDPTRGWDMTVMRSGSPKKIRTIKYDIMLADESSPINSPGWEDKIRDPLQLVSLYNFEKALGIAYANLNHAIGSEVWEELFPGFDLEQLAIHALANEEEDDEPKQVKKEKVTKKSTPPPAAKKTAKKVTKKGGKK